MTTATPDRNWTQYQRRQALDAVVEAGEASNAFEAATKLDKLEFQDPEAAAKLYARYDEAPQ